MLNFYDNPGNPKQQTGGHSRERESVIPSAQANNQNMNTYEAPANLMNRLSPKMPIESTSFHGGNSHSN
jgi:hypothetical protein